MTAVRSPVETFWNALTLSNAALVDWRRRSWLGRWVGSVDRWSQASWLLPWGEPIAAGIALLTLALSPFVSTALMGLLMIAAGAIWLLLTLSDGVASGRLRAWVERSAGEDDRTSGSRFTPIHLVVALYFAISIAATAWSPVKVAAAAGLAKLVLNLGFFLALARVLQHPRWRSRLILVYLLAALATSVYGLQQWFGGAEALATWVDPESPLNKTTRIFSYLGNPNLLAAYLLPALPLSAVAILAWSRWLPKALAVTMFTVNSAALVLTFSRGGWIAMVLALGTLGALLAYWWTVKLRSPFWRRWALPIVLGGGVAIVLLAVLFVPVLRDRTASMFAGRGDSSNSFRINVWLAVVEMIKARPILGIGPGNSAFNKIYPLFQKPKFNALSAYSIFLEVCVETGFIGFACFLWLLFLTAYHAWRQIQRLRSTFDREAYWLMAALAALVGMLGHGFVDTVWYRPQVSSLWWFVVATIASYYQPPTRAIEPTEA